MGLITTSGIGLALATAVIIGVKPIRIKLLTTNVFNYVRKILPPISETERKAIAAGDVWFEGGLFQGNPDWEKLLKYPKPALSSKEQQFLDVQVDHFCEMLNEWQIISKDRDLPKAAWDYIKKEKFLGMIIPEEYGGLGFSALANSAVVQKLYSASVAAGVSVMVPNSLGPAELLLAYGTNEQKQYYLPRLANGTEIPCFGLTSNFAGSDATSISDLGVIKRGQLNGKEVIGLSITFDKRYITLSPIATLIGLAIKIVDPERLLGGETDLGITLCLIPAKYPGVETGHRHNPLHQGFMNGPIRGKDVFVSLDSIIGGPNKIGFGWTMLVECLSAGRGISLPALAVSTVKVATRVTGAYAKIRKQFGLSISKFEGVEAQLARIAGMNYIAEASRLLTLTAIDLDEKPSIITAIMKCHATEFGRKALIAAMDIHGGKAIMLGPKNYLANAYCAIPIAITVEGSNIMGRNLMIFGQGAFRAHPYLQHEVACMQDGDVEKFDGLLLKHIAYVFSNFGRLVLHNLTGWYWSSVPEQGEINAPSFRILNRFSIILAVLTDSIFALLGGELKRKEQLSACLGDVFSYLYLGSSVLKYFNDFGNERQDKYFVEWSIAYLGYKAQERVTQICVNFPNKIIGKMLHWIIFPFGYPVARPSFKLDHQLSVAILEPSTFRERLTSGTFMSKDPKHTIAELEECFKLAAEVQTVLQKLDDALIKHNRKNKGLPLADKLELSKKQNILDAEEYKLIDKYARLSFEIIRVDEFDNLGTTVTTQGPASVSAQQNR